MDGSKQSYHGHVSNTLMLCVCNVGMMKKIEYKPLNSCLDLQHSGTSGAISAMSQMHARAAHHMHPAGAASSLVSILHLPVPRATSHDFDTVPRPRTPL